MEKDKLHEALKILYSTYPNLHHYLHFRNPLELLVATILSAQVRDEMVNAATPALFKNYTTAQDYVNADSNELFGFVKNINLAGNKVKYIQEACRLIATRHDGEVPRTMAELVDLPGIGRKTANVILQNAFGIVEGVVVDTHVLRVSYRLGITTTNKNAKRAENDLMNVLPKCEWRTFPHLMKNHGRAVCKAPTPLCCSCVVKKLCIQQGVNFK